MSDTKIDNGGPAFPQHGWSSNPEVIERMKHQGGMTLRDWFAGQALQGQAHRLASTWEHWNILAKDCYDIADAMLAARNKKE